MAGFALDGKWDGLYVGRRNGGDLIYAGKVDHGFDPESAKKLRARLKARRRECLTASKPILIRMVGGTSWQG
jgi:bifunctional non-homologous end joining protein LigD